MSYLFSANQLIFIYVYIFLFGDKHFKIKITKQLFKNIVTIRITIQNTLCIGNIFEYLLIFIFCLKNY